MVEEFAACGLSENAVYVVGAIKYVPSLVFFLMSAGIIFLDRDEKKKSHSLKKARFVDHS